MPHSLAEDAIALLINLAEQGEIDPWDVKVIEVIDRFLSEMTPVTDGREPYEKSLSSSGQAFLYASMLVLLKADSLVQAETVEDELLDQDGLLEGEDTGPTPLPPHLERRLRRRAVAPAPKRRRVTLTDLIEQLRAIAQALEDPTPRKRLRRPAPQSRSQAVRAIAQLAHQENLSEVAATLEQFFATHWETLDPTTQNWLDFELILQEWSRSQGQQAKIADPPVLPSTHDRVGIFWALLLLSAQSKVELAQDEFYQDLRVRPLTESSLQATDGSA